MIPAVDQINGIIERLQQGQPCRDVDHLIHTGIGRGGSKFEPCPEYTTRFEDALLTLPEGFLISVSNTGDDPKYLRIWRSRWRAVAAKEGPLVAEGQSVLEAGAALPKGESKESAALAICIAGFRARLLELEADPPPPTCHLYTSPSPRD